MGNGTDVLGMEHKVKLDLGIPCLRTHDGLQKIQLKTLYCGNLNQNIPILMSSDLTGDVAKFSISSKRLYS